MAEVNKEILNKWVDDITDLSKARAIIHHLISINTEQYEMINKLNKELHNSSFELIKLWGVTSDLEGGTH